MNHILTIDLEDWHQAYKIRFNQDDIGVSRYLEKQLATILELLEIYSVKTTFFCLGKTIKEKQGIVKMLAVHGHDIQCHGYGHRRADEMTIDEFREDVRTAKRLLEDLSGREITGYRAPEFSITSRSKNTLRVLAEEGYRFDSSIFPFKGKRYGWPGFSSIPIEIRFTDAPSIIEMPPFTFKFVNGRIPLAGGGYFRVWPRFIINMIVKMSRIDPKVYYFHPYEFCATRLKISEAVQQMRLSERLLVEFSQNLFRNTIARKVATILEKNKLLSMGEYCANTKPESTVLFSSLSD